MSKLGAQEVPEGFVLAADAARKLRMTREQIIRRVISGALPGEQINGLWCVRSAAVRGGSFADAPHETVAA